MHQLKLPQSITFSFYALIPYENNSQLLFLCLAIFFSSTVQAQIKITPEMAKDLGAIVIILAEKTDGVKLGYSPNSIEYVDKLILTFRKEGMKPEQVKKTLIVLACYVGEVAVRNLDAKWEMPNEDQRKFGFKNTGITTKNGLFSDPIQKACKLLINGEEDSLVTLYQVMEVKNIPFEQLQNN